MSIDYVFLLGGHSNYELYNDVENIVKLKEWCKTQVDCHYDQWNYVFGDESEFILHCPYGKNCDLTELFDFLKELKWSDHMFLGVSSNSDPYEFYNPTQIAESKIYCYNHETKKDNGQTQEVVESP